MPRVMSMPIGMAVIRELYNRHGRSYLAVGIPPGVAEHLGWEPGMQVIYYPTKYHGLCFRLFEDGMHAANFEDYDPTSIARGRPQSGPRKGSIAEMAQQKNAELEDMNSRLAAGNIRRAQERRAEMEATQKRLASRRRRQQSEHRPPDEAGLEQLRRSARSLLKKRR